MANGIHLNPVSQFINLTIFSSSNVDHYNTYHNNLGKKIRILGEAQEILLNHQILDGLDLMADYWSQKNQKTETKKQSF